MLEWTGERFVPWMDDPFLASEHIHRYVFARSLASGRRVADLASGEGYGTAMLAAVAARVVGLDIAEEAVRHSQEKYASGPLSFVQGSIAVLPFADASFDLVTCFEALEHIESQEALVREVARVLAPGGKFLVSTPDRDVYSGGCGNLNPFHCRELDRSEFESLLRSEFPHVNLLGQAIVSGSWLSPLGPSTGAPVLHTLIRDDELYRVDDGRSPSARYLVAVASREPWPECRAASLLVDNDGSVMTVVQEMSARLGYVEEQFVTLEATNSELESGRRELESGYGELKHGHLELEASYGELEASYGELKHGHLDLEVSYEELKRAHLDLEASYGELKRGHLDLEASYRDLERAFLDREDAHGSQDERALAGLGRLLRWIRDLGRRRW